MARIDTEGDGELRERIAVALFAVPFADKAIGAIQFAGLEADEDRASYFAMADAVLGVFGDVERELADAQARGDGWRQKYHEDTAEIARLKAELAGIREAAQRVVNLYKNTGEIVCLSTVLALRDVLAESESPKQ